MNNTNLFIMYLCFNMTGMINPISKGAVSEREHIAINQQWRTSAQIKSLQCKIQKPALHRIRPITQGLDFGTVCNICY